MICYVSQDDIKYLLRLLKTKLSSLPPNLDKAKISVPINNKIMLIWPICHLQICFTEIKSNIMYD